MPPESADLLIEARWVLPIAPVNTVLADHAIVVTGGRIVGLGPSAQMNALFEPRERLTRSEHAVLPGFVNAHSRAATTLLRGLPVRGPRTRWLRETLEPAQKRALGPDFVRDGTQLAIAEMLRAGITSFADSYLFPEEVARAASAARMRAAVGLPVADAPNVWAESATAHLAKAESLWDEYKSDPWVCLHFAPHDAGLCDETLVRVRRIADELDARVAMEVHATDAEIQDSLSRHGRRPLQRLHELGLLRQGFTASQMNRLDEEDLDLVARTGICVVACVQSNLRLGSGACPVLRLDLQQATVGLGTGDAVSGGALDMLAEARAAALIANAGGGLGREPGMGVGFSAVDVLRLSTLGSAAALGMNAVIGSIEIGKAADLACFDLRALASQRPNAPRSQPDANVADSIVFATTRQQVSDVWTSGRAAVRDGQLVSIDEQRLAANLRQWAERSQAGVES